MAQEPVFTGVNPALKEAAGQVLQHLGLGGEAYNGFITLEQLAQATAAKETALPGQRPWDYAYGAACEILYLNCRNPALPGYSPAFQWLRSYYLEWFNQQLNGDPGLAEDLAADLLEKIVRRLEQVRFPTAFLAWTHQVARNRLKDYFSEKERGKAGAMPPTPAPSIPLEEVPARLRLTGAEIEDTSPGVNPEAVILNRELRGRLLESIKKMRPNTKNSRLYRRIIVGFYFEGKDIEGLAAILGLTPVQVTKLKSQALLNLRKIWQKEVDGSTI